MTEINKIAYNNQIIEVPNGISSSAVIKIIAIFYPEINNLEPYIDKDIIRFKNKNNFKGAHRTHRQILKEILDFQYNDDKAAFEYHENPKTQRPEPISTIPDASDTGKFFIGGEPNSIRNSNNGFNESKVVGGELSPEAKNATREYSITVVGDSLSVGTAPYLKEFYWIKDNYNTQGSRQWKHSEFIYSALDQLEAMKAQLNNNVILILGTNRGVETSEIDTAVNIIGANRKILLVNTASEVSHREDVSKKYLQATEKYDNVFLVDWLTYVKNDISKYYQADGAGGTHIHMNSSGYKKHAEFIVQALYQANNTSVNKDKVGVTTGGGKFSHFPTKPSVSTIVNPFGSNGLNILTGKADNPGIDIAYLDNSKEVFSVHAGVVKNIKTGCMIGDKSCGAGYGNFIEIEHNNGYKTVYSQLSEVLVKKGQAVKGGQLIAKMGRTGRFDSVQLHFELRKGNNKVDPSTMMSFSTYQQ